jgi:hypothetical protein
MESFISLKLIFIIVALLVLLVYWAFNFIILYHLARFGIGVQPKKFAAVFLLGSVILFSVSVLLFANSDINSLKSQFERLGSNAFNITNLK